MSRPCLCLPFACMGMQCAMCLTLQLTPVAPNSIPEEKNKMHYPCIIIPTSTSGDRERSRARLYLLLVVGHTANIRTNFNSLATLRAEKRLEPTRLFVGRLARHLGCPLSQVGSPCLFEVAPHFVALTSDRDCRTRGLGSNIRRLNVHHSVISESWEDIEQNHGGKPVHFVTPTRYTQNQDQDSVCVCAGFRDPSLLHAACLPVGGINTRKKTEWMTSPADKRCGDSRAVAVHDVLDAFLSEKPNVRCGDLHGRRSPRTSGPIKMMETTNRLIDHAMSCPAVPILSPFGVNLMHLFMWKPSISVPSRRVRVSQNERGTARTSSRCNPSECRHGRVNPSARTLDWEESRMAQKPWWCAVLHNEGDRQRGRDSSHLSTTEPK